MNVCVRACVCVCVNVEIVDATAPILAAFLLWSAIKFILWIQKQTKREETRRCEWIGKSESERS